MIRAKSFHGCDSLCTEIKHAWTVQEYASLEPRGTGFGCSNLQIDVILIHANSNDHIINKQSGWCTKNAYSNACVTIGWFKWKHCYHNYEALVFCYKRDFSIATYQELCDLAMPKQINSLYKGR